MVGIRTTLVRIPTTLVRIPTSAMLVGILTSSLGGCPGGVPLGGLAGSLLGPRTDGSELLLRVGPPGLEGGRRLVVDLDSQWAALGLPAGGGGDGTAFRGGDQPDRRQAPQQLPDPAETRRLAVRAGDELAQLSEGQHTDAVLDALPLEHQGAQDQVPANIGVPQVVAQRDPVADVRPIERVVIRAVQLSKLFGTVRLAHRAPQALSRLARAAVRVRTVTISDADTRVWRWHPGVQLA